MYRDYKHLSGIYATPPTQRFCFSLFPFTLFPSSSSSFSSFSAFFSSFFFFSFFSSSSSIFILILLSRCLPSVSVSVCLSVCLLLPFFLLFLSPIPLLRVRSIFTAPSYPFYSTSPPPAHSISFIFQFLTSLISSSPFIISIFLLLPPPHCFSFLLFFSSFHLFPFLIISLPHYFSFLLLSFLLFYSLPSFRPRPILFLAFSFSSLSSSSPSSLPIYSPSSSS